MVNVAMNCWMVGLLSFLTLPDGTSSWNPNGNIPGGPFSNMNNNNNNNERTHTSKLNENHSSPPPGAGDDISSESELSRKMVWMMDRKKAIAQCAGMLGGAAASSLVGVNPANAAEPLPTRIELTVDTEYLLRCLDFFNGDLNMAIATIARSRQDSEIKVDPPREELGTVLKAIYTNKSPQQLEEQQYWLPATIVPYQENLWAESWAEKKYRVITSTENGQVEAFTFNNVQAALAAAGGVAATYPASYAYYTYQNAEEEKKAAAKRAAIKAKKDAKAAAAKKKKDKGGGGPKGAKSKSKAKKGDDGAATAAKKKKSKVKGMPKAVKLSVGEDGELYAETPSKTPKKDPSSPSIVGIDTARNAPEVVDAPVVVKEEPATSPPEVVVAASTSASSGGGGVPATREVDAYAAAYAAAAAASKAPLSTAAVDSNPPVMASEEANVPENVAPQSPPPPPPAQEDFSSSFAEALRQMTR